MGKTENRNESEQFENEEQLDNVTGAELSDILSDPNFLDNILCHTGPDLPNGAGPRDCFMGRCSRCGKGVYMGSWVRPFYVDGILYCSTCFRTLPEEAQKSVSIFPPSFYSQKLK